MSEQVYTVQCTWDAEAAVWVAASDDVPGLATGADTLDALVEKLKVVIPELLEANGLLLPDHQDDIPFVIMAERHERAPVAA
jgi:predicted RNase H-like HicB family nuclease